MKTIKYKVIFLSLVILCSGGLLAQDKHEISVWGAGGLSTLKYKTTYGKHKNGFGGAFGLGYTFFFSEKWGLGTGAELSFYQSKAELAGLKDSYEILDVIENENATLYIDAKDYTEKQRLMTVNIPLMVQYQTEGKHRFYAALGGKVGIPISEKFKISDGVYDVYAYYPRTNQTLYDPMYPAGYGRHDGKSADGGLDFKIAYMASAEAGVKWKLQDGLSLYTGAYFDYGLNNIDKNVKDKSVLEYVRETPVDIRSNSVLQSRDTEGNAFTNKVKPMALGLKVKLAFGSGKVNTSPRDRDIAITPIIPQVPSAEIEAQLRAEEEARLAAERAQQEEVERLAREREAQLRAEEEAARKKAEYEQARLDVAFTLHNFQLGKAAITPEIKAVIDKSIDILKAHPEMKIYCTGYTCDKGTTATNMKVSTQRAESVRDFMVNAGIDAGRIVIRAEGENDPAYPNTNEDNRKLNRRVEVEAHE